MKEIAINSNVITDQKTQARRFNWPRLFGYDFFISFKLGPPPIGAQSYASDLARRLRELDFTVFFSEEEAPPGAKLDTTLIKALHRSQILVVIANEGALVQSQWVRKEVEEFRHKHPRRPVIPINVGGTIAKHGSAMDISRWLDPEGSIWLDETSQAIEEGITSQEVIKRLEVAPRFMKANTWLRLVTGVIFLSLATLTAFAFWQWSEALRETQRANAGRLAIAAEKEMDQKIDLALLLASESVGATTIQRTGQRWFERLLLRASKVIVGTSAATSEAQSMLMSALLTQPRLKKILHGHENRVSSAVFSPDGKHIASASWDGTVRLWDAESGQTLGLPLKGYEDPLRKTLWSVAFSPDGKRLASASREGTVRLWDAEKGQLLGLPLKGHDSDVLSVAFSPDGKLLASASEDKTIRLWDSEKRQPLGPPLQGHEFGVGSVTFSPDSKLIASASDDTTVRLWYVENGQAKGAPLPGQPLMMVRSVAFSPDGKHLASASDDKTIRLWDVESGQPLGLPLKGHESAVRSVTFSPDGKRLASASDDNTVRLWNAESGQQLGPPIKGHEGSVYSVAFSPDGKTLATASEDKTVRLWDVENDQPLGEHLKGNEGSMQSVDYESSKSLGARLGAMMSANDRFVGSVTFSPDGKHLASASDDNTVRMWDVANGQPLGQPLKGHNDFLRSVAFSPDGKRLASASNDKTVRLWDAESGQPLGLPLKGHEASIGSVTFSPDGRRLASASNDNTVRLWDAESGQPLAILKGHADFVRSVAFSPNGKLLASASWDKTVRLWDAESGQPLGPPMKGHESDVNSVAFSPDGKRLASASRDGTLRLWNVKNGQPIGPPLKGPEHFVLSVTFSPDGTRLASAYYDQIVQLWDVESGLPIGPPFKGHEGQVGSVAFSPDGKHLASASSDKSVWLWNVDLQTWLERACDIANRNFTYKEWQTYMGNQPYRKTCPKLSDPDDLPEQASGQSVPNTAKALSAAPVPVQTDVAVAVAKPIFSQPSQPSYTPTAKKQLNNLPKFSRFSNPTDARSDL